MFESFVILFAIHNHYIWISSYNEIIYFYMEISVTRNLLFRVIYCCLLFIYFLNLHNYLHISSISILILCIMIHLFYLHYSIFFSFIFYSF